MKVSLASVLLLSSLVSVEGSSEAASPDEPAKGYVQSGLVVTAQPAGTANHRVRPAISGSTIGVAAAGGVWLTRTLAVEGEVVAGRAVSTPQQFWYDWTEDYTGQSRDVFVGANVRWRPAATRFVECFGGGGLAFSTFAERSIVRTDPFPLRTSTLPDQVETSTTPAISGGIATPLPVSTRMEIVPALSIRWVKRSPHGLGAYAGVGSYAYQFGGVVRFSLNAH